MEATKCPSYESLSSKINNKDELMDTLGLIKSR